MLQEKIKELANLIVSQKNNSWFIPGVSSVPVSGKVFDVTEIAYMIESVADCHWTEWRRNTMFEEKLWEFLGIKHVITCNSWSSANLLAFTALTARELWSRQLKPWDEVITVWAWFPTTINPILQNGCIPVFVDVELWTYEVDTNKLYEALSPKTKAIMMAHTLGNSFNLDAVVGLCKEHDLRLIEDNCDSLGATYDGKFTGTFGDIATISFYPAHHITMGEWGAVVTKHPHLAKVIRSYRDRGRDCRCATGKDDTCGIRYKWKLGNLPQWFDHKYIYSRIGYNLKITDMQAALWVAQLEKLPDFIQKRKDNFNYLKSEFLRLWFDRYFILPQATEKCDPSRFGFVLTVREWQSFTRDALVQYMNDKKIWTRLLFAWNYLKHPAFLHYVSPEQFRIVWELTNSDIIMNNSFWLWVYPWLTKDHLDYMILSLRAFIDGE